MEEFKSNSYKSKEAANPPPDQNKKLDKVVSGKVTAKKKTESRKFIEAFIKDDLGSIGSYIVSDVVVPSIKKTILDSVKAILGETGGSRTSTTNATRVSYRSYYDDRDVVKRSTGLATTPLRSGFDYDDILFDNRVDAEAVLEAMSEIVNSHYGIVSVGDMYDLANITNDNFMINKYGWTDLRDARVVPTRDGYMIKLPRALPLR